MWSQYCLAGGSSFPQMSCPVLCKQPLLPLQPQPWGGFSPSAVQGSAWGHSTASAGDTCLSLDFFLSTAALPCALEFESWVQADPSLGRAPAHLRGVGAGYPEQCVPLALAWVCPSLSLCCLAGQSLDAPGWLIAHRSQAGQGA